MIRTPHNQIKDDRITQKDLEVLTGTREPHCLSVYIPTHTTGEAVLQGKDAQTLQVEIRKIRKALEEAGVAPGDIDNRLAPLEELRDDGAFWREQSDGLAIFASSDAIRVFRLPISFEPRYVLGNTYYLVPLAGEFSGPARFYLLSLELERIRLFEGTRRGMKEMPLEGHIPEQMQDRVGYDYEQKSLQMRSQHRGDGKSGYHGHAEADRDRKNEILRYFRSVDKGILPLLEEKYPLLIASQDYLAAIYREASEYGDILEETLTANLSEASDAELHEKASSLLTPRFDAGKNKKWEQFSQNHGTGKATTQLNEILRAGVEGRIDTLFIGRGAECWGTFDADTMEMKMLEETASDAESLINKALLLTLQQGGIAFEKDPEEIPAASIPIAALYRY